MLRRPVLMMFCVLIVGPAFSALAGLDPSLVAWWPLDEGAGTVATDGSGNGNDGTVEGGATWVPGVLGTALQLNGSNAQVRAPHIPFDDRDFTIALWVNSEPFSGDRNVFSQDGANDSGGRMHLRITGAGAVRMGYYNNDLDYNAIEAGEWLHLAFVHDLANTTRRIHVNSLEVATDSGTAYVGTTGDTIIGSQYGGGEYFDGVIDDVQVYHRVLSDVEIAKIMTGLADRSIAQSPSPEDEATDLPRDVVLSWEAGQFAATHDVYLGTAFADVNEGVGTLLSPGQTATSYDPEGLLEFGRTYYWRVDEVNAAPDSTVYKGEVWSFTVEPFAYPVQNIIATSNGTSEAGVGPERTVDGSGLSAADEHSVTAADMWLAVPGAEPLCVQYEFDAVYKLHEMLIWNYNEQFELLLGFGVKDVTVEYSADGAEWTVLGDVELAQATARTDYTANATIDFAGAAAQYVRLTVNSGWGPMGQYGLSEVCFLSIPAAARYPQPADGAADVLVDATLSWRAGREAVTHEMYLGTDPEALAAVDSVVGTSYVPGNLEFGSTYYWRIDEVNEADAISVWQGALWDFVTQEYAVIDDMESYNDDDNVIYDSWIDGWVNGTGSTAGYLVAPFAETSVVNGGSQSMPLAYDNSVAPFYSEAERDLGGMDLTGNGADTLRLFVSGLAPGFLEPADGTILMNGIGIATDGDYRYASKSLTGSGSMIARVDYLDETPNEAALAGVMIRQATDVAAPMSFMCLTGGYGNGALWVWVPVGQAVAWAEATDPVAPPYWVRVDRAGDSLTGFISADGETWTQIGEPRTIAMNDPVLIGLAVTSSNADQATSAQFSNVSFTGNVSGAWQVAELGVAQSTGNAPEPLYVALEDNSGKVAVVTHPDEAATARPDWTEWLIPYSELGGINLANVRTVYVGVGDRNNPTSGGAGTVFVDDLGYGHPVPVAESE